MIDGDPASLGAGPSPDRQARGFARCRRRHTIGGRSAREDIGMLFTHVFKLRRRSTVVGATS